MPVSILAGVGHYVPANVITNQDLSERFDTSDAWITERTGIRERRYFTYGTDTNASMGAAAARMALERAGMQAADVDFIIYATITPDYFFPGPGFAMQHELGMANVGVLDIRDQCSGFVYALSVADQYIRSGMYKTILVVGAEIQSSFIDHSNEGRSVAVIFGDGAGAAVVQLSLIHI